MNLRKLFGNQSRMAPSFRDSLKMEFDKYLMEQVARFPREDCIQIDFHCHDHNSDVPDELWGRILRLPETWLKTKKLVNRLKSNGCDLVTVTNHNNARSCWNLLEKGEDVLVGSEFTCYFPEYELFVHVLTYGFTRDQEKVLNKKRQNIYEFLKYAHKSNLPVILPHPLYFYTRNEKIDLSLFEKFAVMFQRFEVLNGQRDVWQSTMTLHWINSLTSEKILNYAKKHDLDPNEFGVDPNAKKVLTGGSDDHTGIFAGQSGSFLYIKDLKERLKQEKLSDLALEAIKNGDIAPYGSVGENQKLKIALLDYFSQVATKMEDPGLIRILLHNGTAFDKIACFAISNLFLEMQKHKNTMKFFKFVHKALNGKKPNKWVKWAVSKDYRFCIEYLERIADSYHVSPEVYVDTVSDCIHGMFKDLNRLIAKRAVKGFQDSNFFKENEWTAETVTQKIEIPSQLTALFYGRKSTQENLSNLNINDLLDALTFPVLSSLMMAGVSLASTRVLYQNREFLNDFSDYIGKTRHQKRALYLTDTLLDKNGVSSSLSGKLAEIQRAGLPIDFLICHSDANATDHIHVVKPIYEFNLPQYPDQTIRVPDLMEVARVFYEGGYDRIVCSTEGPMAAVALYIKEMFNVKSYFFMHTDWLEFIRLNTNLDRHSQDRVRRLLRALYHRFDGIFVLNTDHKEWLAGHDMQVPEDRIFLTAHHAMETNETECLIKKADVVPNATEDTPVLFYAGRISKEKGLFELSEIFAGVQRAIPNVQLVIAGQGPDEGALQQVLPNAIFLGWQSKKQLSALYKCFDIFVFPSKFDTFGNVIIESFAHGMPVVSYNMKGPKDIIQDRVSGYLVESKSDFVDAIIEYYVAPDKQTIMKKNAVNRAAEYRPQPIMEEFLMNMGLDVPCGYNPTANNISSIGRNIEEGLSAKGGKYVEGSMV